MLGRATVLLALVASGLAAFTALPPVSPAPRAEASLAVEVEPVALDASSPDRASVGSLRYRGGLSLRSADPRFGGLSDLRVSPDGKRLVAVSDCGSGFTATLTYGPDGRLAGLADARHIDLASAGSGTETPPSMRHAGLSERNQSSL